MYYEVNMVNQFRKLSKKVKRKVGGKIDDFKQSREAEKRFMKEVEDEEPHNKILQSPHIHTTKNNN